MALEALDVPPQLHDSMVEKFNQQSPEVKEIPVAATGGENTAPAASATTAANTEAAPTETPLEATEVVTAATEKPVEEVTDDTIVIDPAKKIRIGDETLSWEQLQLRTQKKADMDKERFQLKKDRELFEVEKQDADSAKYWKTFIESDAFLRNYAQLTDSGMSRDEAFAAALKVGNINLPAQAAPQAAAEAKNDLADRLPKLPSHIEPNSDEHTKWYTEVYEPAKMAAVAEMAGEKIAAKFESQRVAEQKLLVEAEQKKQREAQALSATQSAIDANQAQINQLPNLLWTMFGIDVQKLTPEQKADASARLSGAMAENSIDPDNRQWMASHTLEPLHIKGLIREAFPEGKNPYIISQKTAAPVSERPKADVTPPHTAGRNYAPSAAPTKGAERYGSPMEAAVASLDM